MIDIHTHVPTHRDAVPPGEEVVNDEVAARPAGLRHDDVGRVRARRSPTSTSRSPSRSPVTASACVPTLNDDVAAFVAASPERRIGFLSVHPEVAGVEDELERATGDLGLKGIKLGPNYQIFDPLGDAALRLYGFAESRGLPVLFHQGASPVREAPLRYAHPLLMDEVAIRFPELRIVMAHMGHPWWRETIVTIRKHPHVYADVSALFYRPWSLYEGMRLVAEWNVFDKLLFGSDYPIATPAETAAGLRRVNEPIAGTGLPPSRSRRSRRSSSATPAAARSRASGRSRLLACPSRSPGPSAAIAARVGAEQRRLVLGEQGDGLLDHGRAGDELRGRRGRPGRPRSRRARAGAARSRRTRGCSRESDRTRRAASRRP